MSERTMVTAQVLENSVSLRTVSRRSRAPHSFLVLRSELSELEQKKSRIVSDCGSFASLRLYTASNGTQAIQIDFTWLRDAGANSFTGWRETVRLPYAPFHNFVVDDGAMEGQQWSALTLPPDSKPKIEFQSQRNLRCVAEHPVLRHKLGIFLDRHLNWKNSERILVTDDYLPYSFAFYEETRNGRGICGGIILHGEDDLKQAQYSIHT